MNVRRRASLLAIIAIAVLASSCSKPSLEVDGVKLVKAEAFLVDTERHWRNYTPEYRDTHHPEGRCYYAMPDGSNEVDNIYCGPIRHYPDGGWSGGIGPWDRYSIDGFPVEGGYELDYEGLKIVDAGYDLPPDIVLFRPDGREPPKDAEAWARDRRN